MQRVALDMLDDSKELSLPKKLAGIQCSFIQLFEKIGLAEALPELANQKLRAWKEMRTSLKHFYATLKRLEASWGSNDWYRPAMMFWFKAKNIWTFFSKSVRCGVPYPGVPTCNQFPKPPSSGTLPEGDQGQRKPASVCSGEICCGDRSEGTAAMVEKEPRCESGTLDLGGGFEYGSNVGSRIGDVMPTSEGKVGERRDC